MQAQHEVIVADSYVNRTGEQIERTFGNKNLREVRENEQTC